MKCVSFVLHMYRITPHNKLYHCLVCVFCQGLSLRSIFVLSALVSKSSSGGEVTHNFAPGDMVEVAEGELVHLQGKIISIDGNKITMLPKHEDLKVSFPCTIILRG